jgi:hypothetical protein
VPTNNFIFVKQTPSAAQHFQQNNRSIPSVLAWQHQICADSNRLIAGPTPPGVPRKGRDVPRAPRDSLIGAVVIAHSGIRTDFTFPIRSFKSFASLIHGQQTATKLF